MCDFFCKGCGTLSKNINQLFQNLWEATKKENHIGSLVSKILWYRQTEKQTYIFYFYIGIKNTTLFSILKLKWIIVNRLAGGRGTNKPLSIAQVLLYQLGGCTQYKFSVFFSFKATNKNKINKILEVFFYVLFLISSCLTLLLKEKSYFL